MHSYESLVSTVIPTLTPMLMKNVAAAVAISVVLLLLLLLLLLLVIGVVVVIGAVLYLKHPKTDRSFLIR